MTYPSPLFATATSDDSSNYAATTEFVMNAISGNRKVLVITATSAKQSTFTPSDSQTFSYTNQNVYLNGLYLINGTDYTITTTTVSTTSSDGTSVLSTVGSAIVLSESIAESVVIGTEMAIESFTSTSQSGSVSYLQLSGGEITGTLSVDGAITGNNNIVLNTTSTTGNYIQFQNSGVAKWNITKDSTDNLVIQQAGSSTSIAATFAPASGTNTRGTVVFNSTPSYSGFLQSSDSSQNLATTLFVQSYFLSTLGIKNNSTLWSPSLDNSGRDTSSTTQTVYSQTSSGLYQITGNIIYGQFSITLSALSDYSGDIYISLPSTPDSTICPNSGGGLITTYSNLSSTITNATITLSVEGSNAYFIANGQKLTSADITATTSLTGYIQYFMTIPS